MTKGDLHTLFNVFFTFAGFWVMSRVEKQRRMEVLRIQALKKELKQCRARR